MSSYHMQRSSMMSQNSRSFSGFGSETDDCTDEELVKLVNDLKEEIRLLKLENEILEKTIMRLEPALMHGVYQALEYATKLDSSSCMTMGSFSKAHAASKFGLLESLFCSTRMMSTHSRVSTRKSSGKISGTVIYGSGPRVNVLEMLELVSTEMNIQVDNLEKVRNKAAKKSAYLKAQLEEIGIRVNNIEKSTKMFNQDVLVDGWDKIAQRIPAETWIRFMTEWTKKTDRRIGKLRLRTSTLNTQYSRFKGDIKVKADLSENLRPVDFEKLKIENAECEKVIEQKVQQLGELKNMTGVANLTLVVHKKALILQNDYLAKVMVTKKKKERETDEIDKEYEKIQTETENLSQQLDEIRKIRMAYEVPDVMDYVAVKWDISNLNRAIKVLEHRAHIHRKTLTSVNKQLEALENEMD